jgi:phage shock protein E
MRFPVILILTALVSTPIAAKPTNPLIDYDGYVELTKDVRPYRAKRLLTLADFKARAANPKVLVLDARSASAFAEGHIEGAVNRRKLSRSDWVERTAANPHLLQQ